MKGTSSGATDVFRVNQPAGLQNLYMLNNRSQGHTQWLCEIGD